MPYARRKRFNFRRKRFSRRTPKYRRFRRGIRRATGRLSKGRFKALLAPDVFFVKLKTHDWSLLGTGGVGSYGNMLTLGGNSMVPTPQPTGHDQYFAFWNKCYVYGSSLKVMFENATTTAAIAWTFPTRDTYATANDITTKGVWRLPYSRTKLLGPNNGQGRAMIKTYMSTKKLCGNELASTEESYSQTISTAPAIAWTWYVGFVDAGDVTNQATAWVDYEQVFYCKFYDRENLGTS